MRRLAPSKRRRGRNTDFRKQLDRLQAFVNGRPCTSLHSGHAFRTAHSLALATDTLQNKDFDTEMPTEKDAYHVERFKLSLVIGDTIDGPPSPVAFTERSADSCARRTLLGQARHLPRDQGARRKGPQGVCRTSSVVSLFGPAGRGVLDTRIGPNALAAESSCGGRVDDACSAAAHAGHPVQRLAPLCVRVLSPFPPCVADGASCAQIFTRSRSPKPSTNTLKNLCNPPSPHPSQSSSSKRAPTSSSSSSRGTRSMRSPVRGGGIRRGMRLSRRRRRRRWSSSRPARCSLDVRTYTAHSARRNFC